MDFWTLLIIAIFGIVRIWWERREDSMDAAAERARRNYGRSAW